MALLNSRECHSTPATIGGVVSELIRAHENSKAAAEAERRAEERYVGGIEGPSSKGSAARRERRATTAISTAATDFAVLLREERSTAAKRGATSGSSRRTIDLDRLAAWYAGVQGERADGSSRQPKPLVVIFEDSDCLPDGVLEEVLLAFSTRMDEMPFFFVLGVSTTQRAFHMRISRTLCARARFRTITLENPVEALDGLVDRLLVRGGLPVRLGAKPLEWLTEQFLLYTLSVQAFMRGLRFCLLEHFSTSRLSNLCLPLRASDGHDDSSDDDNDGGKGTARGRRSRPVGGSPAKRRRRGSAGESRTPAVKSHLSQDVYLPHALRLVRGLKKSDETYLLDLPSLDAAVDSGKMLRSPASLARCLADANEHRVAFAPAFHCFRDLVLSTFKAESQRKKYSVRRLYVEVSQPGGSELVVLKRVQQHITESPEAAVEVMLDSWASKLGSSSLNRRIFAEELRNIEALRADLDEIVSARARGEDVPTAAAEPKSASKQQRGWSAAKRRKMALQVASKKVDAFTALRQRVGEFVGQLVAVRLRRVTDLPLHEVFAASAVAPVRRAFGARPRDTVVRALGTPRSYMLCDCCSGSMLSASMHDTCVAYALLTEFPRSVNLYDWYVAFRSVFTSVAPPKLDKKRKKKGKRGKGAAEPEDGVTGSETDAAETTLRARFAQATKELRWMGFIRPSNRKPDHVDRMVFDVASW